MIRTRGKYKQNKQNMLVQNTEILLMEAKSVDTHISKAYTKNVGAVWDCLIFLPPVSDFRQLYAE